MFAAGGVAIGYPRSVGIRTDRCLREFPQARIDRFETEEISGQGSTGIPGDLGCMARVTIGVQLPHRNGPARRRGGAMAMEWPFLSEEESGRDAPTPGTRTGMGYGSRPKAITFWFARCGAGTRRPHRATRPDPGAS